MAAWPLSVPGLKLCLRETATEAFVYCRGRITADNSDKFQSRIRDLIPSSRGHATSITQRIVLDMSQVTHIDSKGLGALFGACTAARRKGCDLEVTNLGVDKPVMKKLRLILDMIKTVWRSVDTI